MYNFLPATYTAILSKRDMYMYKSNLKKVESHVAYRFFKFW